MLTEKQYKTFMEHLRTVTADDYISGYRRGLRRHFHGENFGTADEHQMWSEFSDERGEGYRDGFAGKPPPGVHRNTGNRHAAKDVQHDSVIYIRCTREQKNAFSSTAQAEGKKLSAWALELMEAKIKDNT